MPSHPNNTTTESHTVARPGQLEEVKALYLRCGRQGHPGAGSLACQLPSQRTQTRLDSKRLEDQQLGTTTSNSTSSKVLFCTGTLCPNTLESLEKNRSGSNTTKIEKTKNKTNKSRKNKINKNGKHNTYDNNNARKKGEKQGNHQEQQPKQDPETLEQVPRQKPCDNPPFD